MTPIEQINWDKQVRSGELSFGALKAELAATKDRAEKAELAWAEGRKSLNAAIKESIGARESEKWWREKANQSSLSANRRGLQLEASQAALAEQLAARKVDAEEIERLKAKVDADLSERDHFQGKIAELSATLRNSTETHMGLVGRIDELKGRIERLKLLVEAEQRSCGIMRDQLKLSRDQSSEVSRLKKRVNALLRKAKR